MAATALFRKGKIYESEGKGPIALRIYETIVKNYPYSSEAKSSKDKIRELQSK